MTPDSPQESSELSEVNPINKHTTLEDEAYNEIRRVIMAGVLRPGETISVNRMAQQLSVSRLPVIHALRRLASEGFVQLRPHRNVIVTQVTRKELRVRLLMFAALEEIGVREGWPLQASTIDELTTIHRRFCDDLRAGSPSDGADRSFHEAVWKAAGVDHLHISLQTLWDLGAYYRSTLLTHQSPTIIADRIAEHTAILEALQQNDLEQVVQRLRIHRHNGAQRLMQIFTNEDSTD